MKGKKITSEVTVSDNAQVIALCITLLSRIGYSGERERALKTIAVYFDKVVS